MANNGGKWMGLGSEGCIEKGDGHDNRGRMGQFVDPSMSSDPRELMSFATAGRGALGLFQSEVQNGGQAGFESVMRGLSMNKFPGFPAQDEREQDQNWRQLAAANLAKRALQGDEAALAALEETRRDYEQGLLSDSPTIFESRTMPGTPLESMSQLPEEHKKRIAAKALSLGAAIPGRNGEAVPWSPKVMDFMASHFAAGNPDNRLPATFHVATDDNVVKTGGHAQDPLHHQMAHYTPQNHVMYALQNVREASDAKGVLEYPFSHHYVGAVLRELQAEVVKINADVSSAHVRKSMLPGTASQALEPETGLGGLLLQNPDAYASVASGMRDVAKSLAEGQRQKAEASLTDLARGVSDFFTSQGRKMEVAFSPAGHFNKVADTTFGTRGSSTRRSPAMPSREAAPRHMTALWVGRQLQRDGKHMGPYVDANGLKPADFFARQIGDFLSGMDNSSAKARQIASSVERGLERNFTAMGFSDLNRMTSQKDANGVTSLQLKPIALDVQAADLSWGRRNGLQSIVTPGHVGDELVPSSKSVFESAARAAGLSVNAPAPKMATGYSLNGDHPSMTIVGYAARANNDLVMVDSSGKEVTVPRGTRLLSGAMLVRDGNKLTRYDLRTHNPGTLHEADGAGDTKGEVLRFWDPHHAEQQGGYAISSEATIADARGSPTANESTRAGSMFLVFDTAA